MTTPNNGGAGRVRMGWPDFNDSLAIPKPTRPGRARKQLVRTASVRRANPQRQAERKAVTRGPQWDACHDLPCVSCGQSPTKERPTEAHHEPPVARGGVDADCVPLCPDCHTRRHTVGEVTFWHDLALGPDDVKDAVRAWMASPVARYRSHRPLVAADEPRDLAEAA